MPCSSLGPVPNTDRVLSRTIRSMLLACHCVCECVSVSGAVCLCDQTIAPAPGPGTLGVWHKQLPASGPGALDVPLGCNAEKRASPRCTQVSIGDNHPCQSCPPTFAAMSNSCSHRSWCALGKSPTPSFKKWSTRSAPPGAVGRLVGWRCGELSAASFCD